MTRDHDHGACAAPAAHIDSSARVAGGAVLSAGAWIGPDVVIQDGAFISPGAVIGLPHKDAPAGPTTIGNGCWIGPGVCIEPGVQLGDRCEINHGSTLGAFSRIGAGVHLGMNVTVMPNATIEEYARLLTNAYICEYAILRSHCQIMPNAILINDSYPPTALDVRGPEIGKCAIVGVNAVVWPGVKIGYHAMVGALAEVKRDVPDFVLVRGQPATPVCDVRQIRMKTQGRWITPYPWMQWTPSGTDVRRPGPRGETSSE